MTDLSDALLAAVITYGAPLFGLFLMIGAAGAPVPTSLLVIAAGAFSRQGFLNLPQTALLGLSGAVLGDSLSFGLGWLAGSWLERRYGSSAVWQRARETFCRSGGPAIYLTRFLLTAIASPVNIIAGGSSYRYRRFLFFSITGQATWILLYGGLGYAFGGQWELISDLISDFSGLALGIVILSAGIFWYWRRLRNHQARQSAGPLEDTPNGKMEAR